MKNILLKQFIKYSNAGDIASSLLVQEITKRKVRSIGEEFCPVENLLGIGSILQWSDINSIVWGSGYILETFTLSSPPKKILQLRGKLTANKIISEFGVAPDILGDPGLLISRFYPEILEKTHDVGLIPHYVDLDSNFSLFCQASGVKVISPLQPFDYYIESLKKCRIIITSSLHGIVFAHSFKIPAVWVEISKGVIGDGFKFFDYYSTTDIGNNLHRVDLTNVTQFNLNEIIKLAICPNQFFDSNDSLNVLKDYFDNEFE